MIEVVQLPDLEHTGIDQTCEKHPMPMIPLPFVVSLVLGYLLLGELLRPRPRNGFAIAFLLVLIAQMLIVGTRFGYGVESLKSIFPFVASLMPPLAYLTFRNPEWRENPRRIGLWLHLAPLLTAVVLSITAIDFLDLAQGLYTVGYACALVLIGVRERDVFPWVEFNRKQFVRQALWVIVAILFLSAATDFAIAVDAWQSDGANIPRIVSWVSALGAISFTPYVVWTRIHSNGEIGRSKGGTATNNEQDKRVLTQLDALLESSNLHLDPDLNLNRIARKMGVPARQVSVAVNRQHGVSVSHFINTLRIETACQLLHDTDLPITQVLLQSGFNTKSNFNREFLRMTGKTPSKWRENRTSLTPKEQ
ncbi:MAG: helix-turn-helix domain-containing protein [Pseudomonadota bacterium]